MKKIIFILIFILIVSQLYIYAAEGDSCLDSKTRQEADSQLKVDPLNTISILSSVPDCDDKYALMYRATVEIAQKSRSEFYYGNKVYPQGTGNQIPNRYEKYVIENQDQFESAYEGTYRITANNFWIKKITNPENPTVADFKWSTIKLFYDGVWEDGDGSMHSYKLVREFTDWLNSYPNHPNVKEAKELITFLKSSDIYKTHEILVGEWSGEFKVRDEEGKDRASDEINLKISEDDPSRGEFTNRTDNNSWKTTLGVGIEKVNMTFGFERRWFTLEREGQEYLLRTNYTLIRQGNVLHNEVILKKE